VYDTWGYQIPANTPEDESIKVEIKISLGIITDVYMGFPAGCASYDLPTQFTYRLARARLWFGASPILPRSASEFIAADDFVVHAGPVNFPVLQGESTLTWELWNLDDTYPHELWLGINWLTQEELNAAVNAAKENVTETHYLRLLLQNFFMIPGAA
jgi:hypothetical protein